MRLYRPGILAFYCVLNAPLGLMLYGLNVARRGNRFTGHVLIVLGAATFILWLGALAWQVLSGHELRLFWRVGAITSILAPLGVFAVERRPYAEAMRGNAIPARWWLPLVAFLLVLVIAALIIAVFGPE